MVAEIQKTNGDNGATSSTPAIAVSHIVKKYGDFTAVDDISFSVGEGEIFGLLGPNGAGKSTLIRMMTTLIPITAGTAYINGFDVKTQADDVRRCLGVIPQAMTSDPDLTLEENLNIYAKLYGIPKKERKQSMDELLEAVDLTKWRGAQTKTLSGGMRRRLEIARGLVHQSENLLPRRADHRTRSRVAGRGMGDADAHQGTAQAHHADHHALHGRGRPPVRPHRHRRSRQAGGAGYAHGAEANRARQRM